MRREGNFPTGFDVRFDIDVAQGGRIARSAAKKPGPAANVKPTVTAIFKGNGKEANLAYVSAHWGEPFGDKPGIALVFTEKDHSKDNKPDFDAAFGKFGSALIISLHEDGEIYGCQVVHSAHKKQGFSSIGNIETTDFELRRWQSGRGTDYRRPGGDVRRDLGGEHSSSSRRWERSRKSFSPPSEKDRRSEASGQKPDDEADDR